MLGKGSERKSAQVREPIQTMEHIALHEINIFVDDQFQR